MNALALEVFWSIRPKNVTIYYMYILLLTFFITILNPLILKKIYDNRLIMQLVKARDSEQSIAKMPFFSITSCITKRNGHFVVSQFLS